MDNQKTTQGEMENELLDKAADLLVERMCQNPDLEKLIIRKIAGRFCNEQSSQFKKLRKAINAHGHQLTQESNHELKRHRDDYLQEAKEKQHTRLRNQVQHHIERNPQSIENTVGKVQECVSKELVEAIIAKQVHEVLQHKLRFGNGSIDVSVNLTAKDFAVVRDPWDDVF